MKEIDAETNENIRDQRKQHYSHRADLIERNEKKKCAESSRLYKELEKKSFSGPFFDSLLDILKNFQGCFYFIFQSPHPLIRYCSNIVLRSHEHMSQPNQINSRSHQGPEWFYALSWGKPRENDVIYATSDRKGIGGAALIGNKVV